MEIIKFIQSFSNPFLDNFFNYITMFGEETFILMTLTLIYWCIDKKYGYRLGFTYLLSMALNGVVKEIFKVPRPFFKEGIRTLRQETATGYSFPSGHTQGSATLFTSLMLHINKLWFYFVAILTITLVCISRLYLGVHTPLDVIFGLILGIITVYISNKLLDRLKASNNYYLLLFFIPICILGFFMKSEDYFKAAGIMTSFIIGYYIENNYIKFETKQKIIFQIIKYILGISVCIFIQTYFKLILPRTNLGNFIRYFIIGSWITILAPFIFKKLFNSSSL